MAVRKFAEHRCPTCAAETTKAGECVECSSDPRRREFIETCANLLEGVGLRDEQVERAKGLREAAAWNDRTVKWLLGEANRRHMEAERQRELYTRKFHRPARERAK